MLHKGRPKSIEFKHMKSDFYADGLNVKDCKGRSPLYCTIREGNTKSKSWGVHSIIVRRKVFVSHNKQKTTTKYRFLDPTLRFF